MHQRTQLVFLLTVLPTVFCEVSLESPEATFIVNYSSSETKKPAKLNQNLLDTEDIFPDDCPTENQPTDSVIFCRARVSWERTINRLFPKNAAKKTDKKFQRAQHVIDKRIVKKTDGNSEDCLLHKRKEPRPYPHYCYGRGNFSLEDFSRQWQMIRGDLMYTFDFVLYDPKNRKENQLWYLISYLKELATYIDNPMELVEAVKMKKTTKVDKDGVRRGKLVKRNLKSLNARLDKLEKIIQLMNHHKSV